MVFIVVVDGLIAGGKSSILRGLANKGYVIENQKVDEWTYLKPFYEDKKKYAYLLQIQVLESYKRIWEKYKDDKSKKIVFFECFGASCLGSFSTMLYAEGFLTKEELESLEEYASFFFPSLYIWIDTEIETSMRRIKIRGRPGEENIQSKYLEELKEKYVEWMDKNKYRFPIRVIDNNIDGEQDKIVKIILDEFVKPVKFDIAIIGCPGAGKTTLVKKLSDNFRPIEEIITNKIREIIPQRYRQEEGSVFRLEKEFIKMNAEQMKKCVPDKHNCWESVLSLLPVYCKAAVENGELTHREYSTLEKLYKQAGLPSPDDFKLIVWQRPSINQLMHRISERGNDGENGISEKFLRQLDRLTLEEFGYRSNILIVDNNCLTTEQIEEIIFKKLQEIYFL